MCVGHIMVGNTYPQQVNKAAIIIFGRTDTCDIQLDHGSISRRHAAILPLSQSKNPYYGVIYGILLWADMNAATMDRYHAGTPPSSTTRLADDGAL